MVPPSEQIAGAVNPSVTNVVQTDVAYTMNNDDDVVEVTATGLTVTLPPNPKPGQKHTIIGVGFAVTVAGNGHTLAGGLDTVPSGVASSFVFGSSGTGTWHAAGLATT